MTFAEFFKNHDIDDSSLHRIRRRLVLVGRFNQSARGNTPDKFLFTTRPIKSLSTTFKNIFNNHVYKLDYKNFVKALRPSLVESQEWVPGIPNETQVPRTRTKVPRNDATAREGSAVVDLFHYLFLRAISTTDIEDLKNLQPNMQLVLENVGTSHPGKGIFALIREKLKDFALFQPRTYLIVDGFSRLLSVCAQQNDMPPYGHGGALPAGFSEKLIDFVYAEDYTAKFSMEGVDLNTPPWTQLRDSEDSLKMFKNVVAAFRDRLLGLDAEEFGKFEFRHIPLDEQAKICIDVHKDKRLADDFKKSRDAFNSLHQVLRDKALISMVLQWLVESYFKLEEVPKGLGESDKDEFVANRILRTGEAKDLKDTKIAAPVLRATQEERRNFSASLGQNLDLLISLALEKDENFEASLSEAFPQENGVDSPLARAARKLRGNQTVVQALLEITKSVAGADSRKAFVDSAKMALLTIVCPILYELPILTEIDIRDILNLETQRAYLSAILLSQSNKQALAGFGRRTAGFFKGKIDKETRTIKDAAAVQEGLLVDFIELLASGDIKDQLIQGKRQLEAADTILRNLPAGGAGDISPIRPDARALNKKEGDSPAVRAVQKSELRPATAETAIKQMVMTLVRSDSRVAVALDPSAAGTAGGTSEHKAEGKGQTNANEETKSQSQTGTNDQKPEGKTEPTGGEYLTTATSSAATNVLQKFFGGKGGNEPLSSKVVDDLIDEASQAVFSDATVMKRVREDLKAYQQILFLIYQRYGENVENPQMDDFTNPIDRMTLANILLLYRTEMGLGSETSNLHALLIDMVEHIDREGSNINNFIRQISLTRYFDQAKIEQNGDICGLTNLRKTLEAQVVDNLKDTKAFVSELWGIRYLMEHAKSSGEPVEIILFNATASEFLGWLTDHNLTQGSSGPFRCDHLVTNDRHADESILPGLVYLTDSAFEEQGRQNKDGFLTTLASFGRGRHPHKLLLPPMCISTRNFEGDAWKVEGMRWADLAKKVPAPFVVVGPSPLLNNKDDYFKTWLPAGYLFAAHFLNNSDQRVEIRNLAEVQMGRLRVMGYGNKPLSKTLERAFWPTGTNDRYGFAADYYLFIMLAIRFAAEAGAIPLPAVVIAEYYAQFHRPPVQRRPWELAADAISPYLLNGDANEGRCFSFSEAPPRVTDPRTPPKLPWDAAGLLVAEQGLDHETNPVTMRDIDWFNLMRKKMRIDGWEREIDTDDEATVAAAAGEI